MKKLLFLIFILSSSYCSAGHSCTTEADEKTTKSHKAQSNINIDPDRTETITIQLTFPSAFKEKKLGGVTIYRDKEKSKEDAYMFFLFLEKMKNNSSAVAFEMMKSMVKDSYLAVYYEECGLIFYHSLESWISENDKTP